MPESILISSALHHWSIHWMGINSDSQQTSLHSYSNLFFTSFPSMVTIPCRSFLSAFFFSVPSWNPNALLIQGFHNLRLFPWLFNFSLDFDYLSFYHINLNKHSVIDPHFHTHTHTPHVHNYFGMSYIVSISLAPVQVLFCMPSFCCAA